jgi:hypothetical protein
MEFGDYPPRYPLTTGTDCLATDTGNFPTNPPLYQSVHLHIFTGWT